ncbi:VOC family protein [Naumannella huperziae]
MTSRLAAVTFDCLDVARTSAFWSAVTKIDIDDGANEWFATLGRSSAGPAWFFARVDEHTADKTPIHVDLSAEGDWLAEVDRIVGLGAEFVRRVDEHGFNWVTLRDPEGNLFDVAAAH